MYRPQKRRQVKCILMDIYEDRKRTEQLVSSLKGDVVFIR
jgi:hypothetical protein